MVREMKCASSRGRKPRGGLTPEQAAIAAVVVIALVLLLTMRVSSTWTGLSCREQLYQALLVTEDWE